MLGGRETPKIKKPLAASPPCLATLAHTPPFELAIIAHIFKTLPSPKVKRHTPLLFSDSNFGNAASSIQLRPRYSRLAMVKTLSSWESFEAPELSVQQVSAHVKRKSKIILFTLRVEVLAHILFSTPYGALWLECNERSRVD